MHKKKKNFKKEGETLTPFQLNCARRKRKRVSGKKVVLIYEVTQEKSKKVMARRTMIPSTGGMSRGFKKKKKKKNLCHRCGALQGRHMKKEQVVVWGTPRGGGVCKKGCFNVRF